MTGPALRRLIHAASAAVALLAAVSPAALRLGTAYIAASMLVVEAARLGSPSVAALLTRLIPVYREREARRLSGAAWLTLAYAVCAWTPMPAALAGILAGGLADPAGAAVGSRFGRAAPKSVPGSLAVATVAAVASLAAGVPALAAVAAGLVAATVERWPGPFDDNLLLAPAVAATVLALA